MGVDWSKLCLQPFARQAFASHACPVPTGSVLQGEELERLIDETPGMRNLMSNLGYSAPEKM